MPATISGVTVLPKAQKRFREGFKALLKPRLAQATATLVQAAGADGVIDPAREARLVQPVGYGVLRAFVGMDERNAYAADGATPLSPYARLINEQVAYTTVLIVRQQRDWMRRHVPEDVYNWLRRAQCPAGVREMVSVAARMLPGFVPDALATYDPLHRWIDPNGYRLSDRIWRVGFDTRQRLDALLAESIREGESALTISRKVEQFMLPGRAALRTNKPYGTDASYRGMVLGRTEISRAHGEATLIAARLNPYVSGMDWALSASHPKQDVCDELATLGMGGGRLRDPYDLYSVPAYPPHPQCLCRCISVVTATPAQVTDNLRAFMEAGEEPPLTPAADDSLLWLLMGAAFYTWWKTNEREVMGE